MDERDAQDGQDGRRGPTVTMRYWAGARAAAGVEVERLQAADVRELRGQIRAAHPGMTDVLSRCALLRFGRRLDDDAPLADGDEVEALPPFAGG